MSTYPLPQLACDRDILIELVDLRHAPRHLDQRVVDQMHILDDTLKQQQLSFFVRILHLGRPATCS